jgi:cytochrome c peroxidase
MNHPSTAFRLLVTLVCAVSIAPSMSAPTKMEAEVAPLREEFRRPHRVPEPADNAGTPARIALGKALFFDPRLSGSGIISCASCHNPSLGWADGLALGIGHGGKQLGRHTPTIIDTAFGEPYFWDGRAATLEEQAKGPLVSEAEMNMPPIDVINRVQGLAGYRDMFAAAYPGKPIDIDGIAKAIAAYERTIVSAKAPFDRWVDGDASAISDSAKRGLKVFTGKARCVNCHAGWRFTDDGFHDIGLASKDPGRGKLVPAILQMQHAFKTPTLRNITDHAPYMHDGSVATLAQVVEHYDSGFVRRPSLDAEMVPLKLSPVEKQDLVAFMETLTSVDQPVELPKLPN